MDSKGADLVRDLGDRFKQGINWYTTTSIFERPVLNDPSAALITPAGVWAHIRRRRLRTEPNGSWQLAAIPSYLHLCYNIDTEFAARLSCLKGRRVHHENTCDQSVGEQNQAT